MDETSNETRWLVLTSGAGRLMVAADQVVAVFPIEGVTRVPGTASWISGLVRHAGRLFWLVEPAQLLGVKPGVMRLAVRIAARDVDFTLGVDAVESSDKIPTEAFAPAPVPWLTPCLTRGTPLYHLDVPGLIQGISPSLKALRVTTGPAGVR